MQPARRPARTIYELSDGRVIASVYNPTSNGGWVATFEDVTERRQAEAKIMHMARHDALTDLPNRVLFREKMEQALERAAKSSRCCSSISIASRPSTTRSAIRSATRCCARSPSACSGAVRGADTVARLGGDEFAIVQMGAGPIDATELAGRIIEAIAEPFDILGHQVVIGTSVGIAIAPTDGARARPACCATPTWRSIAPRAKGRGTYHFFQPEMDAQMQARHALELDLRKALVAGEFELYYQPLVDLRSGKVDGFEACCAGIIPSAASSARMISFRWPRKSG